MVKAKLDQWTFFKSLILSLKCLRNLVPQFGPMDMRTNSNKQNVDISAAETISQNIQVKRNLRDADAAVSLPIILFID